MERAAVKSKLKKASIVAFLSWAGWFIRGGGYKQLFNGGIEPFNIPSKAIFAVLFGLCAYLTLPDLRYGLGMALAMFIGQAPSLFKESTDTHIASRKYLKWASVVWLRGLIWAAPLILVAAFFTGLQSLYFALAALLMPVCYLGVWFKLFGNKWVNNWTVAEMLFMACIGAVLVIY